MCSFRLTRALTITALIFAVSLCGCGGDEPATERILRPVRYQPVYATGGTRVRTFSGVAKAAVESRLSFKVGGTLQAIHVKVGDRVEPGTLIAELDDSDFKLRVQEAEASLQQARAAARRASGDYERVRELYENRNASKADLDAARASAESADAQVSAAEKRLELFKKQLEYTDLRASVAGSIADVMVDINENVDVGKGVALLTSGSRIEVVVGIPEVLIAQIREGEEVQVHFDALPERTLPAVITEVGVAATGTVTTFPVTVRLSRADENVRPGMAAEVEFSFQSADSRERFLVPSVAVGEDREGRHVFVVNRTGPEVGTVERRPVTTGELTSEGIEVFDGLFEGDLLITAGISKLHDGLEVRLPAEETES